MTFYFIHFLLLHSLYSTEEFSQEQGKDFVDNFETYDDSLWIQDNGTVHCTNHRVRGCALMTKGNIGYFTLSANDFFPERHILSLWMLNNCNSDLCCPNEKCTAYTSAQSRWSIGSSAAASVCSPVAINGPSMCAQPSPRSVRSPV